MSLREAKLFRTTSLFIMEGLSKQDHGQRKILVKAMTKARSEGKKVFIRATFMYM